MTNTKDNEKDGKRKLSLSRKESQASSILLLCGDCWLAPLPNHPSPNSPPASACPSQHSVVGDILENASLVRSKGAFSTSPVSLGQRPANPASVLQCPPDRRGVRSGLFMDETPLKGTTGYLPPVSPPYNGHTAQLYTCYSMRGLHNTDTQYSESIQHGHVNSSHQ